MNRYFTDLFEVLSHPFRPISLINGETFREDEIHGKPGLEFGVKQVGPNEIVAAISEEQQVTEVLTILQKFPQVKARIVPPQTIEI